MNSTTHSLLKGGLSTIACMVLLALACHRPQPQAATTAVVTTKDTATAMRKDSTRTKKYHTEAEAFAAQKKKRSEADVLPAKGGKKKPQPPNTLRSAPKPGE